MTSLESYWAGIAFLLSSVLFQPVHTALSDIIGRKIILYVCIVFFLIGSVVVGSAQYPAALLAGRTIQGIGGGGMEALCEVILTDLTTLKERSKYIGILGLMWAGGSILGPLVGGSFAQFVTWRWIAWIMIPLMAISLVLNFFFLNLNTDPSSIQSKLKRVDWLGIGLLIVGLTSFILALAWGGQIYSWKSWQTLFPLILGIMVLASFAFYERFPTEPIINQRLFATTTSSAAYLGAFIHGIILWCIIYYITLYFEGPLQHSSLQSAIDAFPLIITLTPMAIVCAILIERSRRYLWTAWLGWILCTTGLGTMVLLDYNTPRRIYCGVQIATGVGAGFLLSALAVPVQAAVSVDDAGVAIGTLVFLRALGSTVGVSLGWAIFSNRFERGLKSLNLPPNIPLTDASQAVGFITTFKDLNVSNALKEDILKLYAKPIQSIWIATACLGAVGLLASFFMKELTLERKELGRQAFQERSNQDTHNSETSRKVEEASMTTNH